MNLNDYGLWIGEDAEQLLGMFRQQADQAHKYTGEEMLAQVTLDQRRLLARVQAMSAEAKDVVIMDLLVTVLNLESGLLYYQLKNLETP